MCGLRRAKAVNLTQEQRTELERTARSTSSPFRAIVLLAAGGASNAEISRRLGITDDTVRKWRNRFAASGVLESLDDRHRSGRPAHVRLEIRCQLIKLACQRCDDERAPFHNVWTRN